MKNQSLTVSLGLSIALIAGSASAFEVNTNSLYDYSLVTQSASTGVLEDLVEGNLVLIKNYADGKYLMATDSGSVDSDVKFKTDYQIWKVSINANGFGIMFENQATGKFLKVNSSGVVNTNVITGSGDAGSYKLKSSGDPSVFFPESSEFDYVYTYVNLENYKHSTCISTVSNLQTATDNCYSDSSLWRIEVIQN